MVNFGSNPGAAQVDPMGQILNTGVIRAYLWGGAGFPDVSTTQSTWNANQWYHLTFTYNNAEQMLKVYVNGKLDNTHDGSGAPGFGQTNFYVGGNVAYSDNYFQGIIDEVKVFNHTLTPSEVKIEYNQSSSVVMGNPKNILDGGTAPSAYWKIDENTGTTIYDSSGNGNTANLGSGNSAPIWTNGKIGSALKFDGSNDYVNSASAVLTSIGPTSSFTFSAWIKGFSSQSVYGDRRAFVSNDISSNDFEPIIGLPYSGSNKISVEVGKAGVASQETLALNTFQPNTWYYVTGVFTSGTAYLYVNGQYQSSVTYNATTNSATATNAYISLGAQKYNGAYNYRFDGLIDEVKIYNYARSARQIAMDYNGGAPLAHWKFDEGTGTTANNVGTGGTALNGTLGTGSSSPSWVSGKLGRALRFTSSNQYVSTSPAIVNLGTNDITISVWLKEESGQLPSNDMPVIFRQSDPSDQHPRFNIQRDRRTGSGFDYIAFQFHIDDSNDDYAYCGQYSGSGTGLNWASGGLWHHFVGIRSSTLGKIQIFIDGVLCNQINSTPRNMDISSYDTYIGNYNGKAQAWDGYLDELKIFNYALTASEVKKEYNTGSLHFR
jgi:hypothetical protein